MALADWQRVSTLSAFRRHFPPFVGCAVGRSAEMTALFSSPGTLPDQRGSVAARRRGSVAARLRGATKGFGTMVALDNLDLEIRRGEFLALLGPNGAGKTTAINLIAASLAWLAGYGLLFIAIAAWAYRRVEGRTFG
jgi:ABC-type multidrug transport system fused ATPase/permease subunit